MSDFLRSSDEKLFKRLIEMRDCVSEQKLIQSPCPLLVSQLNNLEVFGEKLMELTRQLRQSLEKQVVTR